jgi:hypothetical protein
MGKGGRPDLGLSNEPLFKAHVHGADQVLIEKAGERLGFLRNKARTLRAFIPLFRDLAELGHVRRHVIRQQRLKPLETAPIEPTVARIIWDQRERRLLWVCDVCGSRQTLDERRGPRNPKNLAYGLVIHYTHCAFGNQTREP